jgi:hypothetical protein
MRRTQLALSDTDAYAVDRFVEVGDEAMKQYVAAARGGHGRRLTGAPAILAAVAERVHFRIHSGMNSKNRRVRPGITSYTSLAAPKSVCRDATSHTRSVSGYRVSCADG